MSSTTDLPSITPSSTSFPPLKESESIDVNDAVPSWSTTILQRIQQRNREQTDPFIDIFQSNTKLWYEHARLRSLLNDSRHQLSTIQHEVMESSVSSDRMNGLKTRLSQLQIDLRDRGGMDDNERKIKYDLTKRVRDQEKLLMNQTEELNMAKHELSSAHQKISQLETELNLEKRSCQAVTAEVESLRLLRTKLETENAQLIARILAEKAIKAEEMNDMIHQGEARQDIVGRSSSKQPIEDIVSNKLETASTATFFSPTSFLVHRCHNDQINDVLTTYNGQMFVTAGADANVNIFESSSGRLQRTLAGSSAVICLDMAEGNILVIDKSSSTVAAASAAKESSGTAVATAPSSRSYQYILAGSSDGQCRMWNLQTGDLLCQLQGHVNKVYSCRLIGHTRAATGSADRTIKYWDLEKKGHVLWTQRTSSSVLAVCPSLDHTTLLSGHQDGSLRFWDINTGASAHTMQKLHSSHITHIICHTNGYHIVTTSKDNTLSMVDTRSYTKTMTFKASAGTTAVSSFRITCDWSRSALSPCGRYIAAGSADGTMVLWCVDTGIVSKVLDSHNSADQSGSQHRVDSDSSITAVFWSGSGIFAAGKRGNVFVWS